MIELATKINEPLPLIDDLDGWDEFPENYEEGEEDDNQSTVESNDNKPE